MRDNNFRTNLYLEWWFDKAYSQTSIVTACGRFPRSGQNNFSVQISPSDVFLAKFQQILKICKTSQFGY